MQENQGKSFGKSYWTKGRMFISARKYKKDETVSRLFGFF